MKCFLALPNKQTPKYIFPLKSAKISVASLKLYNPLIFRRKIQIAILKALFKTRLIKYILPSNLKIKGISNTKFGYLKKIIKWLSEVLNEQNLAFAIFTGTPGTYRKITVQVMDSNAKILSYVKIAHTEQAKNNLQNERDILEHLKSLKITSATTPEVIKIIEEDEKLIMVQSTLQGDFNFCPMKLDERHIMFLSEIFSKTATYEKFENSISFQTVVKRISEIDTCLSSVWKERFKKGLNVIEQYLGPIEIPLGLCHYDFKPWNISIDKKNKKLFVFDWELARRKWIPFCDIFHFIIQPAILVKKHAAYKIFHNIIHLNSHCSQLLLSYSNSIKVDPNLYHYLLIFYLCDVNSFYLKKQLLSVDKDEGEDMYLNEMGNLLDLGIEDYGKS